MSKNNAQKVQEHNHEQEARNPYRQALDFTAEAVRENMEYIDTLADLHKLPLDEQEGAFYALVETIHADAKKGAQDAGEQMEIILPDVDPRLNPSGADFDPVLYREAVDAAGGFGELTGDLLETIRQDLAPNLDKMAAAGAAAAKKISPELRDRLQKLAKAESMTNFLKFREEINKTLQQLHEVAQEMQAKIDANRERLEQRGRYQWPEYEEAPDNIQLFAVFLVQDLEEAEANGLDLEGLTVAEIMRNGFDKEWKPIKTGPYYELITRVENRALDHEAARQFLQDLQAIREEERAQALPQIIAKDLIDVPYPIDKSNSFVLWNPDAWQAATDRAQVPGQLSFPVLFKKSEQAAATFVYTFPEEAFDLPKNFDQYDRRVYFAVSAIYHQIGQDMTIRQIFKTMTGSDTNPSKTDREKIMKSLLKMRAAAVDVDCSAEIEAFGKGYEKKGVKIENPIYNDLLLDWSSFRGKVNGKDAEIIHIKSEPVLFNFARVRGQITTIERKLLETPSGMKLTTQVMALQDYLITEISLKNGPKERKLAYTTIEEHCNIKGKDVTRRARDKVKALLQDFKIKGFIEAWKEYKKDGKPAGVVITRKTDADALQ